MGEGQGKKRLAKLWTSWRWGGRRWRRTTQPSAIYA